MSNVSSRFLLKVTQDKLNALSADLFALKRESVSADCSYLASSLIEKYHLVESAKPSDMSLEFAHLEQLSDSLLVAINRLHFCPVSERGQWLELVHKTASDLDFSIAIVGAFV